MAVSGLQVLGFILGVLSWVGMIGTCVSPEWRKNSQGETIIDNTLRYDGLWTRCKVFITGQNHCNEYGFFLELPNVLQVSRGLMISSIALGFIAIIVTVFGLKCVTIGAYKLHTKARVALVGGILFGISGILTGAAVSYYAHNVVQEYYNPVQPKKLPLQLRFEYGYALFIGWATLVLSILSAVVLCGTGIVMCFHRDPPGPEHMREFRPVSILQRAPQVGPMQTFGIATQPVPPPRRVSIHQSGGANSAKLSANHKNGSYQNSYASSSGRTESDKRWQGRRSDDSDRSKRRYNGRTVADVHAPRRVRHRENSSPPLKRPTHTASGSKQEYL